MVVVRLNWVRRRLATRACRAFRWVRWEGGGRSGSRDWGRRNLRLDRRLHVGFLDDHGFPRCCPARSKQRRADKLGTRRCVSRARHCGFRRGVVLLDSRCYRRHRFRFGRPLLLHRRKLLRETTACFSSLTALLASARLRGLVSTRGTRSGELVERVWRPELRCYFVASIDDEVDAAARVDSRCRRGSGGLEAPILDSGQLIGLVT